MRIRGSTFHIVFCAKILIIIITTVNVIICIFVYLYLNYSQRTDLNLVVKSYDRNNDAMDQHRNIINDFYEPRKEWVTSNLGTLLFKHGIESNGVLNRSMQGYFNVLIWKHWPWLKHRHTDAFSKYENNPLYGCSVSNCRFSGNFDIAAADAVVVHLQKGFLPNVTIRDPLQLWIFLVDESPKNTFSLAKKRPSYLDLSNIFNWSMTYRSDSDIPIPYGRTIPLPYPKFKCVTSDLLMELVPYWKHKRTDVLATILASNCSPSRMRFLMNLKKFLKVDIYGGCATDIYRKKVCPGHFRADCKMLSKYLFYIVIENSSCRQYITEKSFHHAYGKGAIPILMGPFVKDCIKFLPPNSFLHVDDFKTPKLLAAEIISISKNITKLLSYHLWRNHFEVVNEHGYFKTLSPQLCRICEALNFNERSTKAYGLDDIRWFLDPKINC